MRLSGIRARHAQPIKTSNLLTGAEPWGAKKKTQTWRDAAEENIVNVKFATRAWWHPDVSCLTASPWSSQRRKKKIGWLDG
jgi:hypothetical protein